MATSKKYFSPFDTRQICRPCADIAGRPFYKHTPLYFLPARDNLLAQYMPDRPGLAG
jgi:hypothetical protein